MENNAEPIYERHPFLSKLNRNDLINILMAFIKMSINGTDEKGCILMDIKDLIEMQKK